MKKVSLTRGLPGSGKTTWALEHDSDTGLCSADDYFMKTIEGGKLIYDFNPSQLGEAHKECFRKFLDELQYGTDHVIVHNTGINAWELSPYVLANRSDTKLQS